MQKIIHFFLVFFLFSTFLAQAQKTVTGSIMSDNVKRSYRLYIPKSYTGTTNVPLLLNFHGYTSNAVQQEFYGSFKAIADTANFLILLPEGLPIVGTSQGFNNFGAIGSKPDDITFTSNLIDSISAKYTIDKNRIYSTGMSNGGFMSYDLACFLSHKIAAIGSVTGSMVATHMNVCQAQHPTPVMQIHGTTDPTVSYDGKGGIIGSVHIDSLVKFWVKFNQCNATPIKTNLPDINVADKCTVEHYLFPNGKNNVSVEFYKIIGGGHTWPGAAIATGAGNTNKDFNASLAVWQFVSKYRLNQLTATKNQVLENPDFNIFPNPSDGFFTVQNKSENDAKLLIYNNIGAVIKSIKIASPTMDFSLDNAPKGIYFYQIKGENRLLKSGKLMVQ